MPKSSFRVLLVDDDDDDIFVIRDYLAEVRTSRFDFSAASSPDEAFQKISQQTFDVYIIDYRLGAVTGLDLLKELIARGDRTPVILLTGYGDHEVDQEAMRVGAADYLLKGELSTHLLERAIRYATYRAQMQTQAITQDRMASIGLLASSLAHEIGTPLGVIRGRAEYLSMQVEDNAEVKKNVGIIVSQIDRVSGLIRSLLNLARGDETAQVSAIEVAPAVQDILELMNHELKKHDIRIENTIGQLAVSPRIRATSDKLHQILLNLVVNSVHAIVEAKKKGRADGHMIRISALDLGAQWSISVEDTGSGISKENQAKLFRPFFTTKDIGVGTGLGLATSYWMIQSWGGSMSVESQEGKGTIFHLIVPKA
ncbi:MAG: sensor histidine kinase [Bdellovibrionia bacterium]